jgi:armadillo repeat-containing protein 8
MRQVSTAPVLAELNNPSTLEAQAQALRALKNEVIGHQQRKELWIRHGVVAPLARILNKQRSSTPRWQDAPSQPLTGGGSEPRSTDEDILVQAIIIIGSLAQGASRIRPVLVRQTDE